MYELKFFTADVCCVCFVPCLRLMEKRRERFSVIKGLVVCSGLALYLDQDHRTTTCSR